MLVAVALAVLWVRSPTYDEAIGWGTLDGWCYSVRSEPHRIQFESMSGLPEQLRAYLARLRVGSNPRVLKLSTGDMVFRYEPPPHSVLGFGWESRPSPSTPGIWYRRATVPYAVPIVLLASPAVLVLRRTIRRRRRVRAGCCVACGYDLRASSAHCPECGFEPEPAAVKP
jgi:hypothetical protein